MANSVRDELWIGGESMKKIVVDSVNLPEGAICYRRRPDGCERQPTRMLLFDDQTGCSVCEFHFELGIVQNTNLFIIDRPEPRILQGFLENARVFRIRCPECGGLVYYDGEVLFTYSEYEDLPDVLECGRHECGTHIRKPHLADHGYVDG